MTRTDIHRIGAGGENPYIWASWAHVEAKRGRIAEARRLYDAATVADSTHAAAWHGWGLLEKQQGNYLRATELWAKVAVSPILHAVCCHLEHANALTALHCPESSNV